jgi:hypothetical protein
LKGVKVPKSTARGWICKHLDEAVPNGEFFTEKVFTKEILLKIEQIIKPLFNYGTNLGIDYDAIIDNIDNEDDTED